MTKWLSDVDGLYSVTVFADGQVGVLRRNGTSAELDVYESRGVFIQGITLYTSETYWNLPGLNNPTLIGNVNNAFLIMSFLEFRAECYSCTKFAFSIVSRTASTTNPEMIGQANYTYYLDHPDDIKRPGYSSHWRWKVNASIFDVNIYQIYNRCDHYLMMAEEIFPMGGCSDAFYVD